MNDISANWPPKQQILVILAHPDDPEFFCGATLARWAPQLRFDPLVTAEMVANLKPATLFGVESQGMLLAAKHGKRLQLLTVDGDIASGAPVG